MVFQCLAHTVEWENSRWRRLDDIHRLRNRFDYGDIVNVSEEHVETWGKTEIGTRQSISGQILQDRP